jgi:7SK snRNA methylphosphate capping enzyme
LDVGCHEGYITITLAQMYSVNNMHGIDIDEGLITKAYNHLEEEAASPTSTIPLEIIDVEINVTTNLESRDTHFCDAPSDIEDNEEYNLLERVSFETTNFLKYEIEDNCMDTILCLSITKWIHLNWGDKGLMQLFQKMFSTLRP